MKNAFTAKAKWVVKFAKISQTGGCLLSDSVLYEACKPKKSRNPKR